MENLERNLINNPRLGDSYGSNIFKVRLADESKGKGKSGGFRIITYLIEEGKESTEIYLIPIFDESEESSITKEDIKGILKVEQLI